MLTVRELRQRLVEVLEATHDVRQAGGGPEVLLLETKFLSDYTSVSG